MASKSKLDKLMLGGGTHLVRRIVPELYIHVHGRQELRSPTMDAAAELSPMARNRAEATGREVVVFFMQRR